MTEKDKEINELRREVAQLEKAHRDLLDAMRKPRRNICPKCGNIFTVVEDLTATMEGSHETD